MRLLLGHGLVDGRGDHRHREGDQEGGDGQPSGGAKEVGCSGYKLSEMPALD